MSKVKFINLELFISESDCEDCGSYEMECCRITSSKKSLNTKLGSAYCCGLEKAELLEAIFYLDEQLDLNLPISKEAKKIMEEYEFSLKEANENYLFDFADDEGCDCYIEIFDLSKYNNNVIDMLTKLLAEKGFEFSMINNTGRSYSGNFKLS